MGYDIHFTNCTHIAAFFDSAIEWYLGELDVADVIVVVTKFMDVHRFSTADIINTDTDEILMTICAHDCES